MKTILVRVTWEDIRKGNRDRCTSCPMARALRRAVHARSVQVHDGYFVIRSGWELMPREMMDFVHTFDSGKPVKPFSFRLRVK